MIKWFWMWCLLMMSAWAFHDEPGSFREYELREERTEIEINITELFHQLTYVSVAVRPRVYEEIETLQKRWNAVILELIEIDQAEHPIQPGYNQQ